MDTKIFCDENGACLEYIIEGRGNKTILLLPPGVGGFNHFEKLIDALSDKYRIIAVNFPGVGRSKQNNPTINTVAELVGSLVNKIDKKNLILIGVSYGGSVAIKLLNIIQVKALILITTGEYSPQYIRKLLRIVSRPLLNNNKLLILFSKIVPKFTPFNFTGMETGQLNIIKERWFDLLDFKLDAFKNNLPTLFIEASKDGVVTPESRFRIKNYFTNITDKCIESGHNDILPNLEKQDFNDIKEFLKIYA